jgi:putative flippase GtrA
MRPASELAAPAAAGLGPIGAAGAERLAVDLMAGAGCVGAAVLIFYRVVGAAGALRLVGSHGLYAFLAAGVGAVGLGFVAAYRGPLAGYPAVRQFLRFGCTGLLNTAVDFGTLNLLVLLAGIYSGAGLVPFNVVAFAAASLNSFTWNKLWTFGRRDRAPLGREFGAFCTVALSGVAINTLILWAITTLVPRPFGLSPVAWLNGAKLAGSASATLWNFLWYRGWVFRPAVGGSAGGR